MPRRLGKNEALDNVINQSMHKSGKFPDSSNDQNVSKCDRQTDDAQGNQGADTLKIR